MIFGVLETQYNSLCHKETPTSKIDILVLHEPDYQKQSRFRIATIGIQLNWNYSHSFGSMIMIFGVLEIQYNCLCHKETPTSKSCILVFLVELTNTPFARETRCFQIEISIWVHKIQAWGQKPIETRRLMKFLSTTLSGIPKITPEQVNLWNRFLTTSTSNGHVFPVAEVKKASPRV